MALRRFTSKGHWHCYFRTSDGKLKSISTGTTDKRQAQDIAAAIMEQARSDRRNTRLKKLLHPDHDETTPAATSTSKGVKIKDLLQLVEKYRDVSVSMRRAWNRFVEFLPPAIAYAAQVTPEIAFEYLQEKYNDQSAKAWNNNKTYLHNLFKTVLLDARMPESPFARVIQRKNTGRSQRPFSDDEAARIIAAAKEPWKSAAMIAWYTGMRQKDCFALRWEDITNGVITILPAKTARHGRSVQIPVHADLAKCLAKLPRKDDRVLGFSDLKCHNSGSFTTSFGKLLKELNITSDKTGIVNFNSFRNSFVTRCDAANIPRHALRGIVGHTDDKQTNLYSHDLTGAKQILTLPKLKSIQIKPAKK